MFMQGERTACQVSSSEHATSSSAWGTPCVAQSAAFPFAVPHTRSAWAAATWRTVRARVSRVRKARRSTSRGVDSRREH